jgi:hypothetical protein
MPERGECHYCGKPVMTNEPAAWAVTGWEVERAGGGANRIVGRRRVGLVAHSFCAEHHAKRERSGLRNQIGLEGL